MIRNLRTAFFATGFIFFYLITNGYADNACWESVLKFQQKYQQLGLWGGKLHTAASTLEYKLSTDNPNPEPPESDLTEADVEIKLGEKLRNRMDKGFEPSTGSEKETEEADITELPDEVPVNDWLPENLRGLDLALRDSKAVSFLELLSPLDTESNELIEFQRRAKDMSEGKEGTAQESLIGELKDWRDTPLVMWSEDTMEQLAALIDQCAQIKKFFGLTCQQTYPRGTFDQVMARWKAFDKDLGRRFKKAKDETSKNNLVQELVDGINTASAVIDRIDGAPLLRRKVIRARNDHSRGSSGKKISRLTITVPIAQGEGYLNDPEIWRTSFAHLKTEVERFWRGNIFGTDGHEYRVQVILEDVQTQKGVLVHRGESMVALAHARWDIDEFVLPPFATAKDNPVANSVMVHEFGHILGFYDRYYDFLNEAKCTITIQNRERGDIMTSDLNSIRGTANTTQLWQLYEAFGPPKIHANVFWNPLIKFERAVEKEQKKKRQN